MSTSNIPIIDISSSRAFDKSAETAHAILEAASTHGFLFIKNDDDLDETSRKQTIDDTDKAANDVPLISPKDIEDMFNLASTTIPVKPPRR